jgi:hypothetical protein
VKPNIKSVQVHPQLSNDGHPVDGALVGAGSFWSKKNMIIITKIAPTGRG